MPTGMLSKSKGQVLRVAGQSDERCEQQVEQDHEAMMESHDGASDL